MASIHIKTAFGHIRRSPFQALAAIFVLGLTFFVSTLLVVLVYASNNVLSYFETRPQVIVFLKDDANTELTGELQTKLGNDERVNEVRYVSKEEAFGIYKDATSYNPLLSELVSPAIFPASLEFSLINLEHAENIFEEIRNEEIVDQIGFTANLGSEDNLADVVGKLRRVSLYIRVGGGVLTGVLFGMSFVVLLVIIGMRMTTRRKEVEILDLIGATSGFIRSPIVLEGLIYAFVGVFVGWLFALIVVLYSSPSLISYFNEIPVIPKNTQDFFLFFLVVLGIELLIGFFLALTGSMLAVSRARKTR